MAITLHSGPHYNVIPKGSEFWTESKMNIESERKTRNIAIAQPGNLITKTLK